MGTEVGNDAGAAERETEGIAGYVTPYPYLERLQPRMEERLARRVPVQGRFCGFCFGRQRETDVTCRYCGSDLAQVGTVDEIPQEVLRLYKAKQSTEARWVHMGAMFGLVLASLLFIYLVIWAPGFLGHPGVAFAALIGGGYVLAQLFGTLLGAQVGYRKGAKKRDDLWAQWLDRSSEERAAKA